MTEGKPGFAGLFGLGYLSPTIVLGLMSATGLLLVYSLNTWLPELMLRAGFGRLGGVGGPMLGGFLLVGGGFALDSIFYVLTGLGLLGVLLTLLVPISRAPRELRSTPIEPTAKAAPGKVAAAAPATT
jgi:MFS transporter, AAHS family, benzoate transport protein